MPFGLTNVGATYQRAVRIIFHDLIHKTLEDYTDDILVKSHDILDHLHHLEDGFDHMEKYHFMLNLKTYVFGVTSGKLLGIIFLWIGTKVNPKKVKDIMGMPPFRKLRKLKSLQGNLKSIRRFIPQLIDICHPFTHLLKKDYSFKWYPICQCIFETLNQYLENPPILVS